MLFPQQDIDQVPHTILAALHRYHTGANDDDDDASGGQFDEACPDTTLWIMPF